MGMIVTFTQTEKGRKPFRLFNSWLDDPEFVDMARTGLSTQSRGTDLFKLQSKLKAVRALQRNGPNQKAIFKNRFHLLRKNWKSRQSRHLNLLPHQLSSKLMPWKKETNLYLFFEK